MATLTRWMSVRESLPWEALVRDAFHGAYGAIGEAYQGVGDVDTKIAAMSRYPDDLLACTASAGHDLAGLLVGKADSHRLFIYDLFVARPFRRGGIGRELVATAVRGSGAQVVAAEVNRENAASRAFFESMGFCRHLSSDWLVLGPPAGRASVRLKRVILEGRRVRLEPLSPEHHEALCAVGLDPELWRWTAGHVGTPEEMRAYIARALDREAAGSTLPFVIIDRASGEIVGCTRFGCFEPGDRRVEIGWTWLARRAQRTGINVEAKYLMLRHAFETLRLNRVELKADVLNTASRMAILALGATEEGILRRHMVTSRGRVRDTALFSIIADDWPAARERLERRLAPQPPG
jgi:RimJ/RimL family protein N-acetyltransferase